MLWFVLTANAAPWAPVDFSAQVLCDDGNAIAWDSCTDGVLSEAIVSDEPYVSSPDVAVLNDGSFVVVWDTDTVGGDIMARHFDVDGTPLGASFEVASGFPNACRDPRIAALADGGYAITWEKSPAGVYRSRFSADDTDLSSGAFVGSGTAPRIAANPAGGHVILWQQGGSLGDWFFQSYSSSGAELLVSPVALAASGSTGDIAAYDGGILGSVSYWNGTDYTTLIQRYDEAGVPVGSDVTLTARGAVIDAFDDGGFAVGYTSASFHTPYVRLYDASDGFLTSTIASTGSTDAQNLSITTSSDGVFLAWEDVDWGFALRGRALHADGSLAGPQVAASHSGSHYTPQVASADGRFLLVWQTFTTSADETIDAQWLDPAGTPLPLWDPYGLPEVTLVQEPLTPGATTTFTATGALPGETVTFLRGSASGAPSCPPVIGGQCLALSGPALLGSAVADADGVAELTRTIPAGVAAGREIATQAVVIRGAGGADSVVSRALVDTTN